MLIILHLIIGNYRSIYINQKQIITFNILIFSIITNFKFNMQNTDGNVFSLIYLIVIAILIVYAISGTLFQYKHIHIIHETGLGIIIGWCFGGLRFWYAGTRFQFQQSIFFYALLPAIIFSGGYNLKKTGLFQNFNYISIYGIIGTLVSFFAIVGLTILINNLNLIRNFNDINQVIKLQITNILLYSATICATDSVAALTLIKADKYPKLFSIIFGQGMVNDAVAIILFRSVFDISQGSDTSIHFDTILVILKNFVLNLIFSLLIGISISLLCTYIFKRMRFLTTNPVIQVVLIYLFGIFSYALAEEFHFSGVISVLVSGIVLAHFNFYNLSPTGQLSTGVTFQTISFGAQSFLFVYLGMSFWNYVSTPDQPYSWSWTFILLQIAICTIARFASTFILSGIFYLFMKKSWKVGLYELGIVWFAGIIRGSVAFALILTVPYGSDQKNIQQIQIIKSSVLMIVFVTTIILGGLMPKYIQCSLKREALREEEKIKQKQKQNLQNKEQLPLLEEQKNKKIQKSGAKKFFGRFDQDFFKPWFIYNYVQRKEEIKKFKKLLKLNSPEFKGGQFIALMNTNVEKNLQEEKSRILQKFQKKLQQQFQERLSQKLLQQERLSQNLQQKKRQHINSQIESGGQTISKKNKNQN